MEALTVQDKGLCSIEIGPNGLSVAYATGSNGSGVNVSVCEFQPYAQFDYAQLKEYLKAIVSKHGLKKSNCNLVLHPDYYKLTLINTPNVPSAEYKNAIRWQIKDLINYPLEDAAIDIFYPDNTEKTLKKIYVITAQNSLLQGMIDVIQDCELYPVAVDIREFAIRNLVSNQITHSAPIGILSINNGSCLIMFTKQNNIQFVRRFNVNLKAGNYNDLITELQRSFSYCQTELKQEIPVKFFMFPQTEIDRNATQIIAKNLNKEILTFALQDIATFTMPINQQLESNCWVAVGGALRNQQDRDK